MPTKGRSKSLPPPRTPTPERQRRHTWHSIHHQPKTTETTTKGKYAVRAMEPDEYYYRYHHHDRGGANTKRDEKAWFSCWKWLLELCA